MIFSKEKWNSADEIRPYISVSTSLHFETMQAPLQNAFGLFIQPIVGNDISILLEDIYQQTTDINTIKANASRKELQLLYLSQRANALLAFWYDYDEIQLLIGDSGAKRQESEQAKTPYKYQELSLKEGWKNKGFDALDNLIYFLEQNTSHFPGFKNSTYYTQSIKSIVRNTTEVNEYYTINNSRLIFLRLKAHFRVVEDTIIKPRLSSPFFDELKTEIAKENTPDKFNALRTLLIPVVVFYSISRLIRETGSLTDKGLFFQSLKGGDDSFSSHVLVTDERIIMQANRAEADAISYWLEVEQFLKKEFNQHTTKGKKIPDRDNTNKKSFWA